MKKIINLMFLVFIIVNLKGQTISPNENTQFCPKQTVVFTVRIPKIQPGTSITVTGIPIPPNSNDDPNVTQSPYFIIDSTGITKFNFDGQFGDENIKQTFRVSFTLPGAPQQTIKDFDFKYVKSLKNVLPISSDPFNGTCKVLNLGVNTVTVPPCQIVNIPLTFNNIKWGTTGEGNDFCWGKITQYEYQLPIGWSIGSSVSTGTNWILDDSSVVITSDLGNGVNGKIRVRPANASCGINLNNNQTAAEINTVRPKPGISFTGSSVICTANTFTSTNVPSWVTNFNWQLTPSSVGTTSGGNPVTITKLSDGFAQLGLTIGAPSCPSYSYTLSEILPGIPELIFGSPTPNPYFIQGYDPNGPGRFGRIAMNVNYLGPGAAYKWYVDNILKATTSTNNWSFVPQSCDVFIEVSCIGQTTCGDGLPVGETVYFPCISNYRVINQQNTNEVIIEGIEKNKFIKEVKVFDKMGAIKKAIKYPNNSNRVRINFSDLGKDIYTIQVFDGKTFKSYKVAR